MHFRAVLQATLESRISEGSVSFSSKMILFRRLDFAIADFFVYFDSVKWSKPEAGLTFWSNTWKCHTDDDYESAESSQPEFQSLSHGHGAVTLTHRARRRRDTA